MHKYFRGTPSVHVLSGKVNKGFYTYSKVVVKVTISEFYHSDQNVFMIIFFFLWKINRILHLSPVKVSTY